MSLEDIHTWLKGKINLCLSCVHAHTHTHTPHRKEVIWDYTNLRIVVMHATQLTQVNGKSTHCICTVITNDILFKVNIPLVLL